MMTDPVAFVPQFAHALQTRGKQPATVEGYRRDALNFLHFLSPFKLPLGDLEPDHLFAYQDHLREHLKESPNSIRRAVIGVRQFFRFLLEEKLLASTPFDLVPIPPRDETLPPSLEAEELDALIDVALKSAFPLKGRRDAAIIALLAYEGVKASELIALRWTDFIEDKGLGSLRIAGPRARVINLAQESTRLTSLYRNEFRNFSHPALSKTPHQHMVLAFKGRDSLTPSPQISRHGLKFMLYELGTRIGHAKLNTEMLRHFATQFHLGLGRSPEEIMQHFGLRRVGNIAKHLSHVPERGQKPARRKSHPTDGRTT